MRFDQPSSDETPRLRLAGRTTPNSIRWRIYFLVAALLFVLFAMRWAGNPATWHWLAPGGGGRPVGPMEIQRLETLEKPDTTAAPPLNPSPNSIQLADESNSDADAADFDTLNPSLENLEWDFWSRFIRQLDNPSRVALFQFVFRVGDLDDSQRSESDQVAGENLLRRLSEFNQSYATRLLAEKNSADDSNADRRRQWYDLLFDWQQRWQTHWLPALSAILSGSGEISAPDLQQMTAWFERLAESLVVDDAPVHLAADQPFWNRLIQRATGASDSSSPPLQVTQLQLSNQPDYYRGRVVEIAGRIRAVRPVRSGGRINGIEQYLELWVQPADGGRIPFCIFATRPPDGLPKTSGRGLQEVNCPVRMEAYFYKNRSYQRSDGALQFCPTLVAKSMELSIESPAETTHINTTAIFAITVLGIAIAILSAWLAYRSSRVILARRRSIPKRSAEQLKRLEQDPQIESIQQRLSKLN